MIEEEFINYMQQHPIDLSKCIIDDNGKITINIPKSNLSQEVLDYLNTKANIFYHGELVLCYTGNSHNCRYNHYSWDSRHNHLNNTPRHYYCDNNEIALPTKKHYIVYDPSYIVESYIKNPSTGKSGRLNNGCHLERCPIDHGDINNHVFLDTDDPNLVLTNDYYTFCRNRNLYNVNFKNGRDLRMGSFEKRMTHYGRHKTSVTHYRFSMAICAILVKKEYNMNHQLYTTILYQHVGNIVSGESPLAKGSQPGTGIKI